MTRYVPYIVYYINKIEGDGGTNLIATIRIFFRKLYTERSGWRAGRPLPSRSTITAKIKINK